MSISLYIGLGFLLAGCFLQEFAIYRRTMSRANRKCNDSKATLLLYYSTGMVCELTGVFLVSFYTYLISTSQKFPVSFFIYALLFSVSSCVFSVFLKTNILKIMCCSGFGTIIMASLKEFTNMVVGTLDEIYPGALEIAVIFTVFVLAVLIQSSIINNMLGKYTNNQVYGGYYFTNLIFCFVAREIIESQGAFQFDFGILGILIGGVGSFVMSVEKIIDNNKLIQEIN